VSRIATPAKVIVEDRSSIKPVRNLGRSSDPAHLPELGDVMKSFGLPLISVKSSFETLKNVAASLLAVEAKAGSDKGRIGIELELNGAA